MSGATARHTLTLPDEAATRALAEWLAPRLGRGDVLALCGPLGAGKSALARALIAARLAAIGPSEDIPSPSFTLVQTYVAGDLEIWHCDLFRLAGPDEIWELGLDEAFETALCLIEWPDRLGRALPADCLRIEISPGAHATQRRLALAGAARRWHDLLADIPEDLCVVGADD